MVKKQVFVLWGEGRNIDLKIKSIRQSFSGGKTFLNAVLFDPHEHNSEDLHRELNNFSFAPRLFIVRNSHSLEDKTKKAIEAYISGGLKEDYFIFVFPLSAVRQKLAQDAFYSWLFRLSPPLSLSSASSFGAKELFPALRKGCAPDVFLAVNRIFQAGERKDVISLKILGAIASHFSFYPAPKGKNAIFRRIFQADRILKQVQVNPQYILEVLLLRTLCRRKLSS